LCVEPWCAAHARSLAAVRSVAVAQVRRGALASVAAGPQSSIAIAQASSAGRARRIVGRERAREAEEGVCGEREEAMQSDRPAASGG
jgi:hypothetical protein